MTERRDATDTNGQDSMSEGGGQTPCVVGF
jgi:hypothetical protein